MPEKLLFGINVFVCTECKWLWKMSFEATQKNLCKLCERKNESIQSKRQSIKKR